MTLLHSVLSASHTPTVLTHFELFLQQTAFEDAGFYIKLKQMKAKLISTLDMPVKIAHGQPAKR